MYKIKSEKGKVVFIMRTGKTFVRNTMPLSTAQSIINRSKDVEETDKRGFGMEICVDDVFFFPVDEKAKAKKKEDADVAPEVTKNE